MRAVRVRKRRTALVERNAKLLLRAAEALRLKCGVVQRMVLFYAPPRTMVSLGG